MQRTGFNNARVRQANKSIFLSIYGGKSSSVNHSSLNSPVSPFRR